MTLLASEPVAKIKPFLICPRTRMLDWFRIYHLTCSPFNSKPWPLSSWCQGCLPISSDLPDMVVLHICTNHRTKAVTLHFSPPHLAFNYTAHLETFEHDCRGFESPHRRPLHSGSLYSAASFFLKSVHHCSTINKKNDDKLFKDKRFNDRLPVLSWCSSKRVRLGSVDDS